MPRAIDAKPTIVAVHGLTRRARRRLLESRRLYRVIMVGGMTGAQPGVRTRPFGELNRLIRPLLSADTRKPVRIATLGYQNPG